MERWASCLDRPSTRPSPSPPASAGPGSPRAPVKRNTRRPTHLMNPSRFSSSCSVPAMASCCPSALCERDRLDRGACRLLVVTGSQLWSNNTLGTLGDCRAGCGSPICGGWRFKAGSFLLDDVPPAGGVRPRRCDRLTETERHPPGVRLCGPPPRSPPAAARRQRGPVVTSRLLIHHRGAARYRRTSADVGPGRPTDPRPP